MRDEAKNKSEKLPEPSAMTVKNLQLNENASFMEQWEFIDKNWQTADKLKLIFKLELGKPPIRMLTYPALLKRMFQWKPEMREAFVKQWNEAHKNNKNDKIKDTRPLLTEKDAEQQKGQIKSNWDNKFVNELTQQLRLVELLSLLEESPEAKKAFIDKWNGKYGACEYALDKTLAPVAQAVRIENWKKKCAHEDHKPSDVKRWLRNRLSHLDYLKNFMAQWSKEDQKKFIDEWNERNKTEQLLAGKDLFEQFLNILNRGIGKEVKDEIRYTESSKRLNAILEKRNKEKANVMRFLQNIGGVSILAYKDCVQMGEDLPMKARGWFIKQYQKGGRNVVEIKCDVRSWLKWNAEEVEDVFNTDKKGAEDRVFTSSLNVFEEPAGSFAPKKDKTKKFWKENGLYKPEGKTEAVGLTEPEAEALWERVSSFTNPTEKLEAREVWGETGMQNGLSDIDKPTIKKGKDAFHFNPKDGLRSRYYTLPFGEFLKLLKGAKRDLAKLDLTKFEDKGAKVSLDEFLKHPMWTFTVPINRLWELKGAEKMIWIKILETKQNAVTFIVLPQSKFQRAREQLEMVP